MGTALRGPRELDAFMESPPESRLALTVSEPRAALIAVPVARVTLIVGIVIGVTMVASSPSPGGSPAALFAMITAIAPAFWALSVLVLNVQVPRSTSATAPAGKPTRGWQPSVSGAVPSSVRTTSPVIATSASEGP
jgi:hypothetical protein